MPDATVLLASHGFTTMSLAYFGAPGLPPTLQNIPVENFRKSAPVDARSSRNGFLILLQYSCIVGVRRRPCSSPQRIPRCRLSWRDLRAMFDGKAPQPGNFRAVRSGPGKASADLCFPFTSPCGLPLSMRGISRREIHCSRLLCSCTIWKSSVIQQCRDSGRKHSRAGAASFWKGRPDMAVVLDGRAADGKVHRRGHPYGGSSVSYDSVGHWIPCEYLQPRREEKDEAYDRRGTPEGHGGLPWRQVGRRFCASSSRPRSRQQKKP